MLLWNIAIPFWSYGGPIPKKNFEAIFLGYKSLDSRTYDPLVYFFASSGICLDD